jgi:phosphatidate phosphatase APP1
MDTIVEDQPVIESTGSVLMVHRKPQFMVISDVDDTFLISHSTRILKKVRLMLFKNAITRLPFPGVVEFYQALQVGGREKTFNPIFYVSSSERNLYDLLYAFCEYHEIPKGPLLLRDMQTSLRKLIFAGGGDHLHKLKKIRSLLRVFPDIPVILIGDSGQRDPEIYLNVVKENPGRVKGIYIRNIGRKRKLENVRQIAHELEKMNVDMILASDTAEAAHHAAEHGFIDARFLPNLRAAKEKDAS